MCNLIAICSVSIAQKNRFCAEWENEQKGKSYSRVGCDAK
jgi:hypothetical protein